LQCLKSADFFLCTVAFSLLFILVYFLFSLMTSSLIQEYFISMFFNLQTFGHFILAYYLLVIYFQLCLQNTLCKISGFEFFWVIIWVWHVSFMYLERMYILHCCFFIFYKKPSISKWWIVPFGFSIADFLHTDFFSCHWERSVKVSSYDQMCQFLCLVASVFVLWIFKLCY
jgi:hypothetical protein